MNAAEVSRYISPAFVNSADIPVSGQRKGVRAVSRTGWGPRAPFWRTSSRRRVFRNEVHLQSLRGGEARHGQDHGTDDGEGQLRRRRDLPQGAQGLQEARGHQPLRLPGVRTHHQLALKPRGRRYARRPRREMHARFLSCLTEFMNLHGSWHL